MRCFAGEFAVGQRNVGVLDSRNVVALDGGRHCRSVPEAMINCELKPILLVASHTLDCESYRVYCRWMKLENNRKTEVKYWVYYHVRMFSSRLTIAIDCWSTAASRRMRETLCSHCKNASCTWRRILPSWSCMDESEFRLQSLDKYQLLNMRCLNFPDHNVNVAWSWVGWAIKYLSHGLWNMYQKRRTRSYIIRGGNSPKSTEHWTCNCARIGRVPECLELNEEPLFEVNTHTSPFTSSLD